MKKGFIIIFLLLIFALMSGCSDNSNSKLAISEELLEQQQESEVLNQARDQVIEKFKNERDVLGTSKFIEDTYKQYPDDDIISTIYNYDIATSYYEWSDNGNDQEYLKNAKSYASKISPTYEGEFSDEIIPFVTNLLGDEWSEIREKTVNEEEAYINLTLDDKVEIHKYIQSQYDNYDKIEGRDSGDKYSNVIFEEVANKYGISQEQVMFVWIDSDVSKAARKTSASQEAPLSYDATLNFDGEMSLIAISRDALDRFLNAISNENQGTIDELLQSGQVAQVPVGTHVNIIEKKIGVAKVKIVDGTYEGNEVWVLIESVHEK